MDFFCFIIFGVLLYSTLKIIYGFQIWLNYGLGLSVILKKKNKNSITNIYISFQFILIELFNRKRCRFFGITKMF
jgi:hypothetical protein